MPYAPYVITFLLICIGGILDAMYLMQKHKQAVEKKLLMCTIDPDCAKVTESRWASFFGVRNELLGFGFFASMAVVMLLAAALRGSIYESPLYLGMFWVAAGGFFFNTFLINVQIFIIKETCFMCMVSAVCNFLLFVNSAYLYFTFG